MNAHARIRRPLNWVATTLLCVALLPQHVGLRAETNRLEEGTPAAHLLVQSDSLLVEGRSIRTEEGISLEHPSSGITFRFRGSGAVEAELRIDFQDQAQHLFFTVLVDGVRMGSARGDSIEVVRQPGQRSYILPLAENLPEGEHEISLYRQNEAGWADVSVYSLTFAGNFLPPPERRARIEFIGDSITAGYGVYTEATAYPLADPYYGDATRSYAFETCQALDLELSVLAASGYGLIAGWGKNNQMPQTYPFVNWFRNATSSALYTFDPPADYVCINLGTNDWNVIGSTEFPNQVNASSFYQGVVQFSQLIREKNPNARIIWIFGMMQGTSSWGSLIQQAVEDLGGEAKGFYSFTLPSGSQGVLGHPGLLEQQEAARALEAFLEPLVDRSFPRKTAAPVHLLPTSVVETVRPSAAPLPMENSSVGLHTWFIGLGAALVGMFAALGALLLRWKYPRAKTPG